MNRYQCIYYDLKNNRPVAVEEVRAGEATGAFQQFIRNRRNEDWTVAEIFRRSNLKIVPFGSDDRYIIDSYGEVVKETDYFRIAG